MEYIHDHGSFADLPFDVIMEIFITPYCSSIQDFLRQTSKTGRFEEEAENESR